MISPEEIKDFQAGFAGDDEIPIFCASLLDERIVKETKHNTLIFKEEFKEELSQFGHYVALINLLEFNEKLEETLLSKRIGYMSEPVEYTNIMDKYTYTGLKVTNVIEQYKAFFRKDKAYQWQNEWRFILEPPEVPLIDKQSDSYNLHIGKLEMAIPLDIKDIFNKEIYVTKEEERCSISFI